MRCSQTGTNESPHGDLPSQGIHAVATARAHQPPKVRVFIEALRTRFGDPPYWERGEAPA